MKTIAIKLGLLLSISAASCFSPAVPTVTGLASVSAILSLISSASAVTGPYVEECLS